MFQRPELDEASQLLIYWSQLTARISSLVLSTLQARVQCYSLALIFFLWSKPHYRNDSFKEVGLVWCNLLQGSTQRCEHDAFHNFDNSVCSRDLCLVFLSFSGHVQELTERSHPWNRHPIKPILLLQSDDILLHLGRQSCTLLVGSIQPSTEAWQV